MANMFNEDGTYNKTDWKTGDRITANKLNKIEDSLEAINNNDIARHVEADARLDALEEGRTSYETEVNNSLDAMEDRVQDNIDAVNLELYQVKSNMTILEQEMNEGIAEVDNTVAIIDNKISAAETNMNNKISQAETNMQNQVSQGKADMEAMVAEVEADMNELQNDFEDVHDDLTDPQIIHGAMINDYKFVLDDEDMVSSLITLNEIEGASTVETNMLNEKKLVSSAVKHICTVDVNSKNYFEDAIVLESTHGASYTQDGNDVTLFRTEIYQDNPTAYAFVSLNIPTLMDGKKYCLFCDEVIINDGASAVELHTDGVVFDTGQTLNSRDRDDSSFNKVFTYSANRFEFRLHCTVGAQTGNVTYKNIQIYEVKDMVIPDIKLNSLPNGVCDEIKDGVLIRRTRQVKLADLTWTCNYTDDNYSMFFATCNDIKSSSDYYTSDNHILSNMFTCNAPVYVDEPGSAYNGFWITSHDSLKEIKIKIESSAASTGTQLVSWLNNNNAQAVYELAIPEYIDVSTSIKVDKGDMVVINTCKPLSCSYDIQLNTRAQIDTLLGHQTPMFTAINDVNDMKKAYDNALISNSDGYCELPNGLIMQWGRAKQAERGNHFTRIYFPRVFPTGMLNMQITGLWTESNDHYWTLGVTDNRTYFEACKIGTVDQLDDCYWFAIGY